MTIHLTDGECIYNTEPGPAHIVVNTFCGNTYIMADLDDSQWDSVFIGPDIDELVDTGTVCCHCMAAVE